MEHRASPVPHSRDQMNNPADFEASTGFTGEPREQFFDRTGANRDQSHRQRVQREIVHHSNQGQSQRGQPRQLSENFSIDRLCSLCIVRFKLSILHRSDPWKSSYAPHRWV